MCCRRGIKALKASGVDRKFRRKICDFLYWLSWKDDDLTSVGAPLMFFVVLFLFHYKVNFWNHKKIPRKLESALGSYSCSGFKVNKFFAWQSFPFKFLGNSSSEWKKLLQQKNPCLASSLLLIFDEKNFRLKIMRKESECYQTTGKVELKFHVGFIEQLCAGNSCLKMFPNVNTHFLLRKYFNK